jgi:hypothetical protein
MCSEALVLNIFRIYRLGELSNFSTAFPGSVPKTTFFKEASDARLTYSSIASAGVEPDIPYISKALGSNVASINGGGGKGLREATLKVTSSIL